MGKCYIFGAGEFDGVFRKPERDDLIIAADGGISAASKAMLTPNLIIGDFDSYDGTIPEGAVVCPREKDDTDTGMAVEAGINEFVLGFLDSKPKYLMGFDDEDNDLAFATPRSWEMVSNIFNNVSAVEKLKLFF